MKPDIISGGEYVFRSGSPHQYIVSLKGRHPLRNLVRLALLASDATDSAHRINVLQNEHEIVVV